MDDTTTGLGAGSTPSSVVEARTRLARGERGEVLVRLLDDLDWLELEIDDHERRMLPASHTYLEESLGEAWARARKRSGKAETLLKHLSGWVARSAPAPELEMLPLDTAVVRVPGETLPAWLVRVWEDAVTEVLTRLVGVLEERLSAKIESVVSEPRTTLVLVELNELRGPVRRGQIDPSAVLRLLSTDLVSNQRFVLGRVGPSALEMIGERWPSAETMGSSTNVLDTMDALLRDDPRLGASAAFMQASALEAR